MIPLYGFVKGDTLGILVVAHPDETVGELAGKLQQAADVRVRRREKIRVLYKDRSLDLSATVAQAGFEPLARFDVEPAP